MFARIDIYFNLPTHQGLGCRYYPEPYKSVMIVHSDNIEARKEFGARHRFKVCMGACYLGGYIGENESKSDWLIERTLTWEKNISTIRKIMGGFPQDSYVVVVLLICTYRVEET